MDLEAKQKIQTDLNERLKAESKCIIIYIYCSTFIKSTALPNWQDLILNLFSPHWHQKERKVVSDAEKHSDENQEHVLWKKTGSILISWLWTHLRKCNPFEWFEINVVQQGEDYSSQRAERIWLVRISYGSHFYSIRENCHLWICQCVGRQLFIIWSIYCLNKNVS